MSCFCRWYLADKILYCQRVRNHEGVCWCQVGSTLYSWRWPRR